MPNNTTEPETPEQILFGKGGSRCLYPEDDDLPKILAALDQFYKAKYEKDLREIRDTIFTVLGTVDEDLIKSAKKHSDAHAKQLGYNLTGG